MAVRKPHEGIGTRRRIDIDQQFKFFDCSIRFTGHEIALAESSVKIRALRCDFYAGLQKRNGVFKIILRHTDPRQQKNDVGIFRREFVGADQQFQSVHSTILIGIDLCQHI